MNQKKNTKSLMILIIIVVILILIGGIAIAFFATDMFKSDKDLFFKYASKIVDSKEGFIENDLLKYFEKLETTPYNDEGSFSTNMTSDKNEDDIIKNVNDFNITYSGNVDTANSKSYQEISLNYSDDVNFPINYKQIENKIGLQTKYVGKNYIAVETDKLNKLFGNSMLINTETLEKMQELDKVELTDEEKNHILTTYKEILDKQLSNEKFSKVKESDQNGYKLSLTGEDIKNILVQILETLKNDEMTLNKLNEYIETLSNNSEKLSANDIDSLIKNLNNNSNISDDKIDITIFSANGKTSKISISTEEIKINIQKEKNEDNLKYSIELESSGSDSLKKVFVNAIYTGLSTMQNIQESYEIGTELEEGQLKYQFIKNVNFTDNINIEEFTDQNSLILTNYEPEQITNFLNAVGERITQVNKQQMEQLGLEESQNPIIYSIPSLSLILGQSSSNMNLPTNELNDTEVNTFNEQFEMYASTNQRGVTVKGLLSMISSNNETNNKNRQISEINFNGEEYEATQENITFIKGDIDTSKNYRVEFEKNASTGAIYRVVINEK